MSFPDWLKNRLTPAKRNVGRWAELAEAMQEFWGELFDPAVRRMVNAQSVYAAEIEDLEKIMAELADDFRNDIGGNDDRPHQIAWRRWELQSKESAAAVDSALRRKFPGLDIEWVPLYAAKAAAYGANFKSLAEITSGGLNIADYFLTSRGKVYLSFGTGEPILPVSEVLAALSEEMDRILPTHIVYDGPDVAAQKAFMAFCARILLLSVTPRVWVRLTNCRRFVVHRWQVLDGCRQVGGDSEDLDLDGSWALSGWHPLSGDTPTGARLDNGYGNLSIRIRTPVEFSFGGDRVCRASHLSDDIALDGRMVIGGHKLDGLWALNDTWNLNYPTLATFGQPRLDGTWRLGIEPGVPGTWFNVVATMNRGGAIYKEAL